MPSNGDQNKMHATSRSLPIALLRAREKVMAPIRQMLHDAGVTEQQWRVLRVLEEEGAVDATEIARSACLLMPSLTRILQHLEGEGLCTRRSDPKDRRRMIVEITRSGKSLIRDNGPVAKEIFARLEDEFGADKMDQLLDLLNELVKDPAR